jgi:hypothetical protein
MASNQRGSPQKPAGVRRIRVLRGVDNAKSETVRERAIAALLAEPTIGKAARRRGVTEKTLRRSMADDDGLKGDLADARRAVFEAGMTRVLSFTGQAVETLAALMRPSAPPAVRLGAHAPLPKWLRISTRFKYWSDDWMISSLPEMSAGMEHRRLCRLSAALVCPPTKYQNAFL